MNANELDAKARAIMTGNDQGGYTVPTHGLYPYQWNWDSAFAAWGFAQFDMPRAWAELQSLMSGQWADGMVPHILFHKPDPGYFPGPDVWGGVGPIPSSGISQPPVLASLMRRIFEMDPDAGRAQLEKLYDGVLRWHRWFMEWRLSDGAVIITHPWEAGRDNAADWDRAMAGIDPSGVGEYTRRDTSHVDASMRPTQAEYDRYIWLVQRGRAAGWDAAVLAQDRPFWVADPTMTFILLRAMRDLAVMGRAIGRSVDDISDWIAVLEDGAQTLWNPEISAYDSRDAQGFSGAVSNASFLSWYAGVPEQDNLATYDRVTAAVPYGVPSLDPAHPKFDGPRYWRGPVWAMMNCMIAQGLADAGHEARAEALRQNTAQLIAQQGFAEYFDPTNGAPAGGGTFTWTAAVWLGWASPNAGSRTDG